MRETMGRMKKIGYILKEMLHMIRKNKLYFICPILIMLALLAFLVYYIGPPVIIAFIYAGI